MEMTTIHFIRHGMVENPANVYYGRLPGYRLSTIGREQARSAGIKLMNGRPIQAVYSSPLLRARQTSVIIAGSLGIQRIALNRSLLESYTPFDGLPATELEARNWDLYTGNQAPFESPTDILIRTQSFITRTLKKHPGNSIVAVTHADVILFLSLWAFGYKVDYPNKARAERNELPISFPANCSVTTLSWDGKNPMPIFKYEKT
jgi:broad specificity phosphatase PhoE